jgi:hypothetical protein
VLCHKKITTDSVAQRKNYWNNRSAPDNAIFSIAKGIQERQK